MLLAGGSFLAGTPARPDAAREGPQVPAALITSLQQVSEADPEANPIWVFAPIGVATNFEVDAINLAQIKAFAPTFDLPLDRCGDQL
jgi:hypothetical protein